MSSATTLKKLLRNFVLRTHLDFMNLLDSLERAQDHQKRKELLQFLETTRQQLVRLMVLVKWLARSSASMTRAQDMVGLLTQRDATYYNSQQFLRALSSKLEDHMFPMWDVTTAVHVMTSGSYRLLPKMLENQVEWKRTIPAEKIAQVTSRLDDKLHIQLLSTVIPPSFSNIRIKDGIVNMTVEGEFEVGLSLRMKPQNPPHMVQLAERDRIQWMLFDLKLLLGVQSAGSEIDRDIVRDFQLKDLIHFLRHQMNLSVTPIVTLHDKLHAYCVALQMDILHMQSSTLNAMFGNNLVVEYERHQKLTLRYWRGAPVMPREGSRGEAQKQSNDIALTIAVYNQHLSIEHQPTLPELETSTEGSQERRDELRIHSAHINLTRLFLAVIGTHANHRVKQLFNFMRNAPPRGYERLELVDEPVISPMLHAARPANLEDKQDGPAPMEDDTALSRVNNTSGRAILTHLLVTMLGERQIRITVDSRDGRLSFEWVTAGSSGGSSGSSSGSSSSSSNSNSSCSSGVSCFGSFVSPKLTRLLGLAQMRLNETVDCAKILEVLEELRLNMVLELAEQVLASINPKDQPQLQLNRHPPLLWPKGYVVPRLCLYVRLVRDPSFFLAIRLSPSTSHIRSNIVDSPTRVTFSPSYQASFTLLQALPKSEYRVPRESVARREARQQGLLISQLPPKLCTIATVLTVQFSEPLNLQHILAQQAPMLSPARALGEIPPDMEFDCGKYNLWNVESLSKVLDYCDKLVPSLFLRCRLLSHDPPFTPIDQGLLSAFEVPLRLYPYLSEPLEERLKVYVQWCSPTVVGVFASSTTEMPSLTFSIVHPSLAVWLSQVELISDTSSGSPQLGFSQVQGNTILALSYPKMTDFCIRQVYRDLESFLTLANILIQLLTYQQQCDAQMAAILPPKFFTPLTLSVAELRLSCGAEQKATMTIAFHERDRRPIDRFSFGSIKLRFAPCAFPQTQFLEMEYNTNRKLMDLLRRVYWASGTIPLLTRYVEGLLAPDPVNPHPAIGLKLHFFMDQPMATRAIEIVGHSASAVRLLIDATVVEVFMLDANKIACSVKRKGHRDDRHTWEPQNLIPKLLQVYALLTGTWLEMFLKKGPLIGIAKEPSGGFTLVTKDAAATPNFAVFARYFSERIGNVTRGQQRQFMRNFWALLISPPQILAEISLILEHELRDPSISLWLYELAPAHFSFDPQTQAAYFIISVALNGTSSRVLLPIRLSPNDLGLWEIFPQRPQKQPTKALPIKGIAALITFLKGATAAAVLDLLT